MESKVPKLRFKDKNGEDYPKWKEKKLENCFLERNVKNNIDLEFLSVTINSGVQKRKSIDSKYDLKEDKSNYKLVEINDIVYNSMRMWQGASGLSIYRGIVSPAYTVLIPKENISSLFFSYMFKLKSLIYKFKIFSQGITSDTWSLKYPLLKEIKINVPCLQEQKNIAKFFSNLDEIIERQEKKIRNIESLKKSLIQKIFKQKVRFKDENGEEYPKWKENKLSSIANIDMGFTPDTYNNRLWKGNIDWLSISGMKDKYIYCGNKKISEEALNNKTLVPINTLIMSFKLTLGKLAIVKKELITNEAICQFYWKDNNISTEYMYAYLNSIKISKYGSKAVKGTTLNIDSLNSIKVKIPSLKEQRKIANFLCNLDKIIEKEYRKLEILQCLKKGLMQRIFI